ncbi:MAG TPA: GGDEF domain-containing protein [Clostridia bacterium]|nr:GGDEF domain-containing protein [Clostridia bacterium]
MNKNTVIKIINLSLMFFLIIGLYFNIIQIPVLVLILFFWFLYNHFIKKMMIENNDLKLKNKLKNESMEIFNELVIEISKLERIQKLKEEDFIVRVFRIFFKALNKADFGSVYLSNDGNVVFIDAIGHDLEALNNEKFKIKDFVFPESQVGLIENINSEFVNAIEKENNQSIRLAKETIVISIIDDNEIYGALALDISVDSNKSFNEDDLIISKTIAKLINSYYKNIKEQLVMKEKMRLEKEKLKKQINIDNLTQLFNKKYFFEVYLTIYKKMKFLELPLGVLLIDIDNYKNYNDTYGHMAGDECLKKVANIFDQYTRNNDLVARYGGEEFIILVEKQDTNQLIKMGEKLRKAVEDMNIDNFISSEQTKLTISVGICSVIPKDTIEPLKVIHEADHALYQSKRNGKNQTSIIELKE